jgi:predicted small lipoprotein YifL
MKRFLSLLLVIAMLLALAACSGKDEPADPAPGPGENETTQSAVDIKPQVPDDPPAPPEPPEPPQPEGPAGTNPLSGLPMEPEDEKLRPIAVMINDHEKALPQLGVSQADIIYEVPAEGGITRMLALFQTVKDVGTIGSIRSARLYYAELATGHDAIYVHAGGSDEAYKNIRGWKMDHIDGVEGGPKDDACFWREKSRTSAGVPFEHTLMTSGERIMTYLGKGYFKRLEHDSSYSYPQEFVDDGTPANGSPAGDIVMYFSAYKTTEFVYDKDSGLYKINHKVNKSRGEYIDGNTGEQVGVTNVLVLQTTTKVLDSEGRLRVDTVGSGKGTYFCGGKSVPIKWSRSDRNHPLSYTLENGEALKLGKGHSYVCIMNPNVSSLEISE